MLKIDKAILDTNQVICDNISKFDASERGLLSQNILAQVRNFVEYIAMKAYANSGDINPNDYSLREIALSEMKKNGNLRFLRRFHDMLQKSVSHYTVDKDGSERLMLKYYEHLLMIKTFLKNTYSLDVLANIDDFPLNTDTELIDYYSKIAQRIEEPSASRQPMAYNERYYIQKIKPFFVNHKIYYEVTFTAANSNVSKFERVIAFTKHVMTDNYAVRFTIHSDCIDVLDKEMSILIINNWYVSIRPCEFDNFSKIFGDPISISSTSREYISLMNYLTIEQVSLTDYVLSDEAYYQKIKKQITEHAQTIKITPILDKCRAIICPNKPGANIIRYLLYKLNNKFVKLQLSDERCKFLSDLKLDYGCIPFDQMPFCSSLKQHNPKIYDLFDSISTDGRDHEFLARLIKNNTEIEGSLFTPISEIEGFDNIDLLIQKYNSQLYYKHARRQLKVYKKYIYIDEYVEDSADIINKLQALSKKGVPQYSTSIDFWLANEAYFIDDLDKKEALRKLFSDSCVALIYGAAGTGKSTFIKHISNFWAKRKKIYLANTHPAVDNMRRKVTADNSNFYTIARFLYSNEIDTCCDVLFIDECSTVSNSDMRKILDKAKYRLLVLVGDVYQIESINFGNWFSIAKDFLPRNSICELKHPYRTSNRELLTVWDRVRTLDDAILEPVVKNKFTAKLDETIFEQTEGDEIILCLNYDGLYGINNINRFLQTVNPNESVFWGITSYKIGDPILFNESNIFSPLIHNNSKGRICNIRAEEKRIWFDIELDVVINGIDAEDYDFLLVGQSPKTGNSIIRFSINKHRNTDEDDEDNDSTIIPFQIAYAVSIHKAQGLEYDSVKIVITNETEERITHNIFYTAITRAKDQLKIYWSPETEKAVLSRLKLKNNNRDSFLLSNLKALSMVSRK